MPEPNAGARKTRVNNATPTDGNPFVNFLCPRCEALTPAPLPRLAHGPLGIWTCDDCDFAFQVRVVVEAIQVPNPPTPKSQGLDPTETCSQEYVNTSRENRLLALHGEELLLRNRLQEIANRIAKLHADTQAGRQAQKDEA